MDQQPKIKPAKTRKAKVSKEPKAAAKPKAKPRATKAAPKAKPKTTWNDAMEAAGVIKPKTERKPRATKAKAADEAKVSELESLSTLVADPIQATHFDVKVNNRLAAKAIGERVASLVLPQEASKQDRRESVKLQLSVNVSAQDAFGDRDMQALAKGPITVSIIGHDGNTLASKTYLVDSVTRAPVKYEGGLQRFGVGQVITHHYELDVKLKP